MYIKFLVMLNIRKHQSSKLMEMVLLKNFPLLFFALNPRIHYILFKTNSFYIKKLKDNTFISLLQKYRI